MITPFPKLHLAASVVTANGSWWSEHPTPHGFTARASLEVARMRMSKFGLPDTTITDGPVGEAAGTRLNRARRSAGYHTLGMRI